MYDAWSLFRSSPFSDAVDTILLFIDTVFIINLVLTVPVQLRGKDRASGGLKPAPHWKRVNDDDMNGSRERGDEYDEYDEYDDNIW